MHDQISQKYTNKTHSHTFHFTDKYGFIADHTPSLLNFPLLEPSIPKISEKWNAVLLQNDLSKMKNLIYKGVPLFLKYKVWSVILRTKHTPHFNISSESYDLLKNTTCTYEHQIHVDVQRTFRRHALFVDEFGAGQSRLFHILVAFANTHKDIGYCQGMSSIAGIILMYFPEKEAYDALHQIITVNNLFALFDKTLSKLGNLVLVQNEILMECVPKTYKHIKGHCDLSVFAVSWYLTLFSRFDVELTLRLWDVFLYYDFTVLLVAVAAIIKAEKKCIRQMEGEKLIHFLNNLEGKKSDVERVIGHVKAFVEMLDMDKYRKMLGIEK